MSDDQDQNDVKENDLGSVLDALAEVPQDPFAEETRGLLARVAGRPPGWLTPHFHLREFYCKNGTRPRPGRWRTYRSLCKQYLEPMRKKFGPCTVHSGYRTRAYNASIGGATRSVHVNEIQDVDDVAADVSFARGTPTQWGAEAKRLRAKNRNGKGGIGIYPRSGFVHVDTRDYQANWSG